MELRADAPAAGARFTLSPSRTGVAAFGRGIVEWPAIDLPDLLLDLGANPESFRRSDANADGVIDLSDAVFTLSWLFTGGPAPGCPDSADSNDDGSIDLSDGVFTLSWLFTGGATPKAPGTVSCGPDPTADGLSPCDYPITRC